MKYSFVIPAYNSEKTIEKCIQSVIRQKYHDWEIYVVDDGSQDSTWEIISRFTKIDSRIKSIKQENSGPGIARNNALKKVCGDYIVFLDADDYIDDDYLVLVDDLIRKNSYDVVIIDNYYEKPDGTIIREEVLSKFCSLSKDELIAVQMTGKMPWGGWRKVIKRSIISEHAIEYSADPVGEEALFSFKVFYYADKIGFLGKKVYHYVDYPTSQSKKGGDDPWGMVVEKLASFIRNELGEDKFIREINSFAYTALAVSLYRISVNHKFLEALRHGHKKVSDVAKKYKCKCNKDALKSSVKFMLPFIKLRILFPIVIASKARQYVNQIL